MIENPGDYVDAFIDAGADYLTIHVEAYNPSSQGFTKNKKQGSESRRFIKSAYTTFIN